MSETGATNAQIAAAAERMHVIRTQPRKEPHGRWPCAACLGQADAWAPCFVPPGYQIVPAGAVVLSVEEARDAKHGLAYVASAIGISANEAERYRALAAKLSGGAA